MDYDQLTEKIKKIGLSRSEVSFRTSKSEAALNAFRNSIYSSNRLSNIKSSIHQPRPPNSTRPKVTVVSPTRKANLQISSLNDLKEVNPHVKKNINKESSSSSSSSSSDESDGSIDSIDNNDELYNHKKAVNKVIKKVSDNGDNDGSEDDDSDDDDSDDDSDDDDTGADSNGDDDEGDDETVDGEEKLKQDHVKLLHNKLASEKKKDDDDDDDYDMDDEMDDIYEEVTDDDEIESCTSYDTSDVDSLRDGRSSLQYRHSSAVMKNYPLMNSLFANKPPTVYFTEEGETVSQFPWELRRILKWKSSTVTPKIIKGCINRSGFRLIKNNSDWLCTWGKHMKPAGFKSVKEFQKVNHFPGTFHIGRKDKLWRNYLKMRSMYGRKEFHFLPQTYILPSDLSNLRKAWDDPPAKNKWIIKPPASARGIGIKVVHKWSQVPKKKTVIVQKYLAKPYLINGRKFDLRIYVFVSGYDPLRVYIFQDGLVRFATSLYSSSNKTLSNRYVHLTNYSINKKNVVYSNKTNNGEQDGFKWSLKSLWKYFESRGINTKKIWEIIKDICVKAIICGESEVATLSKQNSKSRYNCFELFGFDIILDHRLKPWLLEVNISPSLHSSSELDKKVKGLLVKDVLNMIGILLPKSLLGASCERHSPAAIAAEHFWFDQRTLTPAEKTKHTYFLQRHLDEAVKGTVLDVLTADDALVLMQVEDELMRSGNFERILPSSHPKNYLRFFEVTKYYDLLLDEWTKQYLHTPGRAEFGVSRLQSMASQPSFFRVDAKSREQRKWSHSRSNNYPRSKSVPPKPRRDVTGGTNSASATTTGKDKRRENSSVVFLHRSPKPKISVNSIFRKDPTTIATRNNINNNNNVDKRKENNAVVKAIKLKKVMTVPHISLKDKKTSSASASIAAEQNRTEQNMLKCKLTKTGDVEHPRTKRRTQKFNLVP